MHFWFDVYLCTVSAIKPPKWPLGEDGASSRLVDEKCQVDTNFLRAQTFQLRSRSERGVGAG